MASFVHYKKGRGPVKGSTEGFAAHYNALKTGFLETLDKAAGGDPAAKKSLEPTYEAAEMLIRTGKGLVVREPSASDVQGVPILNNLSVKYAAGQFIGLELMPLSRVDQQSGEYFVHDERQALTEHETDGTGDAGQANETDMAVSKAPYATKPSDETQFLGLSTLLNSQEGVITALDLVENVNEVMAMKREIKIRNALTTAANYPTGNKTTLLAGARWDDANGKPVRDIQNGMAAMWSGRGASRVVAAMNTEVWNVLSSHPDMLQMLSISDRGLVSPEQFVNFFGLDGILVSDARIQTAAKGQTASYSRLWGNFFVLARVSTTPQMRNAAFGYTLRWMPSQVPGMVAGVPGFMAGQGVFAMQWYDPKKGAFGSLYYKRSHFEDIKIVAPKTGYLITTPIN